MSQLDSHRALIREQSGMGVPKSVMFGYGKRLSPRDVRDLRCLERNATGPPFEHNLVVLVRDLENVDHEITNTYYLRLLFSIRGRLHSRPWTDGFMF